jgi:hypothetical protein
MILVRFCTVPRGHMYNQLMPKMHWLSFYYSVTKHLMNWLIRFQIVLLTAAVAISEAILVAMQLLFWQLTYHMGYSSNRTVCTRLKKRD